MPCVSFGCFAVSKQAIDQRLVFIGQRGICCFQLQQIVLDAEIRHFVNISVANVKLGINFIAKALGVDTFQSEGVKAVAKIGFGSGQISLFTKKDGS